jgi:hypothetical protein
MAALSLSGLWLSQPFGKAPEKAKRFDRCSIAGAGQSDTS